MKLQCYHIPDELLEGGHGGASVAHLAPVLGQHALTGVAAGVINQLVPAHKVGSGFVKLHIMLVILDL